MNKGADHPYKEIESPAWWDGQPRGSRVFSEPNQRCVLAIYELKDAALNGVEGQGYAFPIKTFRGKEYKGVFFANDETAIETAEGEEEVEFTGTIYDRTRERIETFNVSVVKTVSVGIGERADFVALEKP